jgi:hypothetical protein
MRQIVKTGLSWFTLALGALIGFSAIVRAGQSWMPGGPTWAGRPVEWSGYIGAWLLGLAFLLASVAAMRGRRRAGILFLVFAPIISLCFGYSGSVFQVMGADGNPEFFLPDLSRVLPFWLLFFAPFLVPLVVIGRRKLAVFLFLILAVAAGLRFALSRWSWPLLGGLAVPAALFGVFGGFWLGTWKLGWTALVRSPPRPLRRRMATMFAGCLAIALLDVGATVGFTIWRSTSNSLDCGWRQPFNQPISPRQRVFTARLVRVGHVQRVSGRWAGEWAVGEVEERFWGLGAWTPRFVLLTDNIFWEGETYFIDGTGAGGLLTEFLPIVETGICTRTRPLVYSTLDLHVLRESRDSSGGRIIGKVTDWRTGGHFAGLTPPTVETPLAGARIRLRGSTGTTILTTDQEGVYESDSLPPDDYALSIDLPDTQYAFDGTVDKERLLRAKFSEQDFTVVWNGTIEGGVRASPGGPARVWVQLENSNPGNARINPVFSRQNEADGRFHIGGLSPGRYKLTVNPYGPSEESPFATATYPAGTNPEGVHTFEIGEGEHIKDVKLVLNPLRGRKLEVRVSGPDGKPAEGAWAYVAYQNTLAYESLQNAAYFRKTDHNGVAELHIFGDAHVRVFAEKIVDDSKTGAGSPRYSVPMELDPARLPERINLSVSSKQLSEIR